MRPFPELGTERLKLRKVDPADVPSILKYANNKQISDNILNITNPYEVEDAVFWVNFALQGFKTNERYVFAITLKDANAFIGAIGLHLSPGHDAAQLGYWIGEPFWNKGLMKEAAKEVVRFGFEELGLNKIYATYFTDNDASGKILRSIGMIREGELKDHYKVNGAYKTVYQYRLTRSEYETLDK